MPGEKVRAALARVRKDLGRNGLLPFTDPNSPSFVSIVAGVPVRGSWWGHPAGSLIYEAGELLDADSNVLVLKLWRSKLTLLHRRLWPAVVRIGSSRSRWQLDRLDESTRRLLTHIDREGIVRGDHLPKVGPPGSGDFRGALRELERRLLVLTRSVHTRTGAHALEGESWVAWASRAHVPGYRGSVASARRLLESAASRLEPDANPAAYFPWGRSERMPPRQAPRARLPAAKRRAVR